MTEQVLANNLLDEKDKNKIAIAMVISLISLAMLFATLFLVYGILRMRSAVWPPMDLSLRSLVAPYISTVAIGLSSATYMLFFKSFRQKSWGLARGLWALTICFGLAFFLSQNSLWNELKNLGVYSDTGLIGSILYGFTYVHFGHVLVAFMSLLWPIFYLWGSRLNENSSRKIEVVKNIGTFWHFLGIIWALMFLSIFII